MVRILRWRRGTAAVCVLSMAMVAGCGSSGGVDASLTTVATQPTEVGPVIIDTDVSLDDVMAILYLLRRPDIDVLAVTVNGNGVVRCDAGVSVVLGLLAVAEQESVPVACGAENPLEGNNSFPDPWRDARGMMATAGVLPVGGEPSPDSAARVIAEVATASAVPPTMLLLGTHTNLAQALRDHPDLESKLAAVHIMGGAIDEPGNTLDNPNAEWNLWIDPVAVSEVFATDLPISIVPLDATSFVPLTEAFAETLAGNLTTPEAQAALGLLHTDPAATTSGLFMWDELAVVALVEPTVVTWLTFSVEVNASTDPHLGGTLTVGRGRPARIAMAADRSAFESEYLSTLSGHDVVSPGIVVVSAARSAYVEQADSACLVANADAAIVYASVFDGLAPDVEPSADLMAELWQGLEPILRTQVSSLRSVTPPQEDEAILESLYADIDSAIDGVSASVDAAVAGDDDALAALTGQSGEGEPFDDVDRRAREFGFQVCGAGE